MALSPHIHPEAVRKEIKGPQSGLALYSLISALGARGMALPRLGPSLAVH